MSTFNLFELPEELVLEVTRHLELKELASFVRTSKTSRRIAHQILYAIPLEAMRRALKWACRRDQTQTIVYLFQANPLTLANNPELGSEPLYSACIKGEASLVRTFLDAGVSPGTPTRSPHSFPPVVVAAMYNHAKVVDILTAAGARLGSYNFIDTFSILCRGKADRLATAQIFVNHGLNITQVDRDGNSFLHHACRRTPSAAATIFNAELLLDLGLDVNHPNRHGETPLILAIKANSAGVIRFLLSRGADANAGSGSGQSPLYASLGDTEDPHETVKCLLTAGATITESFGLEFIRHALVSHWPRSLAHFLNAWTSQVSNSHCPDPSLFFCAAAGAGDVSMLKDLLQQGEVDANCEVEGRTALVAAAEAGQDDAIEFLLPHMSNYDYRTQQGRTALHVAILHGTEHAVRLLLPQTKFICITDTFLRTPLLDAVEYQSTAVVSLLLDRILSPTEPSCVSGHWLLSPSQMLPSALRTAVELGKLDTVRLLLEQGHFVRSERGTPRLLYTALLGAHEEIALEVIQSGISLEGHDSGNFTPLMRAAESGYTSVVQALINKGVDLAAMSPLRETAMTLAVDKNHPEVVRCLLAAGASPYEPIHVHDMSELRYVANVRCASGTGFASRDSLFLRREERLFRHCETVDPSLRCQ